MRKRLRRILSLLLALAVPASLVVSAAASEALGEDLTQKDTLVNESTTLSSNVFWSSSYSNFRTENLVTYKPNGAVHPLVTYGGILTGTSTISATAKTLEANGYRVVAGMNGDFYNTSTGLPCGIVVSQGELKSSDAGYYAIGFKADGTAVLGKPHVKVNADLGYAVTDAQGYSTQVVRQLAAVNKARTATGGIFLYTYDFNSRHTTGNTEAGVDVVCTVESGSLSIGGTVTLRIDKITQVSSATPIEKNQIVLSANAKSPAYYTAALLNAPLGGTMTLNVSADEGWDGVQNAVGALYALVQNGAVVSGLPSGANPRTAVGQKADGTLVFYTIDGRQSGYSIGATMTQIASRLVELGCVTGLCLDGGGSTTLTVTQPDANAARTVNKPSGGSERAVSNQIFLVATNQPSGVLHHFYVDTDNSYVLAGSKVSVTASAVDTNYIPMTAQYALSASAGTLDGNVLTTPASGGDITVTASGDGKTGSTVVHAVTNPDAISVKRGGTAISSLNVVPGGTVNLTASAVYGHRTLKADAGAFTWALDGNIGTVDANGTLTAVTPGSGTLTVTGGGKTVSIPVKVSSVALNEVDGFENGVPAVTGYSYGGKLSANTDMNFVKFGRKSAKLDYTFGSDGTATVAFDTPYSIDTAYTGLNFWVYGDNSGSQMSVLTSDGSATAETPAGTVDFTGWKQLSVTLPGGAASLTGFKLTGTAGSGSLYLDQMTATYAGMTDAAAPVVTANLSGTALSAAVKDDVDGVLPKSSVSVLLDGKAVSFDYNASTGAVSAALAVGDDAGHRVTVLARDASGNIGRASCDIAGTGAAQFTDTEGVWCGSYVDWLKTVGITNGYADGTFRPGRKITRQEFAVMLCRYLGLDTAGYAGTSLPFADAASIASYAVPSVQALYAAGVIGGTQKNGQLYFNPKTNLTRSQAAAMIGRTQEKGYASAPLNFSDAAVIPAYAAGYIQTMAAQGVIGGYSDGSFRPAENITRGQMAKILYTLR
jgi:exopolysaccharide biosynthesis protein